MMPYVSDTLQLFFVRSQIIQRFGTVLGDTYVVSHVLSADARTQIQRNVNIFVLLTQAINRNNQGERVL